MFFKKIMPRFITVAHYIVHFETTDHEEHVFSRMRYINESEILCSALEFYLISVKYLEDNSGYLYPMSNVLRIWAEKDDEGEVIESKYRVWYSKDELI